MNNRKYQCTRLKGRLKGEDVYLIVQDDVEKYNRPAQWVGKPMHIWTHTSGDDGIVHANSNNFSFYQAPPP